MVRDNLRPLSLPARLTFRWWKRSPVRLRSGLSRQPKEPRIINGPGPRSILFECRSEEHTSELQSLMRISYAVFCLKKKNIKLIETQTYHRTTRVSRTQHEIQCTCM